MSASLPYSTVPARRANRSAVLSRAILGTLLLSLGVAVACGADSDYLCQRQIVNANRTKITPLTDKSYRAKDQSTAENECINDSRSGAQPGENAECSCASSSSKNRVAPTAPFGS